MTIIYIVIIIILLLFILYYSSNKSKTKDENLFDKYSKDVPFDENTMKNFNEKYKKCDDVNCQNCDKLANMDDEYILPTVHLNIINAQEAKYILNESKDKFKDSGIVSGRDTKVRKSKTAWLNKNDPVVKKIIMRVCSLTNTPFENAEKLQVVKYDKDGYYNEHFDTVTNNKTENEKFFLNQGGNRIITMLIYLNDDFTEGETRFILLNKKIKPPKYSGILFYTLDKKMEKCHPKSYHAGLPIKSGNKYIANVWIRQYKNP
jgi:prolyl 4-hydroxylase